jgi:hypothetical protein
MQFSALAADAAAHRVIACRTTITVAGRVASPKDVTQVPHRRCYLNVADPHLCGQVSPCARQLMELAEILSSVIDGTNAPRPSITA